MGYENITAEEVYRGMSPLSNSWNNNMEAWVEAQNIMEVRAVIISWFNALEDGTAELRLPDPRDEKLTQEKADLIISEMDADFEIEKYRYNSLKVDKGPEFFLRLSPRARFSMAQEILSVLMTEEQIEQEASRRIKNKEPVPDAKEIIYYNQQYINNSQQYSNNPNWEPRQMTAAEQAALAAEDEVLWSYYGAFQ